MLPQNVTKLFELQIKESIYRCRKQKQLGRATLAVFREVKTFGSQYLFAMCECMYVIVLYYMSLNYIVCIELYVIVLNCMSLY